MAQGIGERIMKIGQLDQQVDLYSHTVLNDFGDVIDSYSLVATVWARVLTQAGSEAFEAARVNAKRTIRVLIRYRTDVNATWKLSWAGDDYYVTAVDRSNRRDDELWLTCQEVEAE